MENHLAVAGRPASVFITVAEPRRARRRSVAAHLDGGQLRCVTPQWSAARRVSRMDGPRHLLVNSSARENTESRDQIVHGFPLYQFGVSLKKTGHTAILHCIAFISIFMCPMDVYERSPIIEQ
jgi:hypothetical protein